MVALWNVGCCIEGSDHKFLL